MWVHDPITFSHKPGMVMVFKNGRKVLLKKVDEDSEIGFLGAKGLKNFIKKATHCLVAHLFAVNAEVEVQERPTKVENLLEEFFDVFLELRGLPPKRDIEHEIILQPGSHLVLQKPYRYSHLLKNEIEKQMEDILA